MTSKPHVVCDFPCNTPRDLANIRWPAVRFRAEFMQVAKATTVGFLVMGFIGFFVKLIHIPINNILMA